jgi:hypothetical protein
MDLASPKLAEFAGLSQEASEKLWYDIIFEANNPCLEGSTSCIKVSKIYGTRPMD